MRAVSHPLQLAFDFLGGVNARAARSPLHATPIGEFAFELRRGAQRRSLAIEVHPDLRVIVRAPRHYPRAAIEDFVSARSAWIQRQLAHFRAHPRPPREPCYAPGSEHAYLGQTYRLRFSTATQAPVTLTTAELVIGQADDCAPATAQRLLDTWYRARAREVFAATLARCHAHPRFARYTCPTLAIRAMRTRWGSLGPERGMTLNLALIRTPLACIEYVVMHELCHLRYRGHGKGFYRLLDAVAPAWQVHKRELEREFGCD
jgi:predicted metal-dependent hydrolase